MFVRRNAHLLPTAFRGNVGKVVFSGFLTVFENYLQCLAVLSTLHADAAN